MHWDIGNLAGILGVSVPIVAIVGGLATGAVAIVTDYRRKREIYEMHHKERMYAMERGLEMPPLPPGLVDDDEEGIKHAAEGLKTAVQASGYGRYRNSLRGGLTWLFVGLGLGVALTLNRDLETASWALIPVGLGLAKLLYYALGERGAGVPPASR